jgi:drug/metabolite transporter (DMT)-like permease
LAWGVYSLRGRAVARPLVATAHNFAYAVPLALGASLLTYRDAFVSASGAGLALASGALASGVAYSLWYAALPALGATRAAVVQLTVPVLAAAGGVLVLGEEPGLRLLSCGALVLGGVALSVLGRTTSPAR